MSIADWSLKSMFDRVLHDTCPMAEKSKIYVDITLHPVSSCSLLQFTSFNKIYVQNTLL